MISVRSEEYTVLVTRNLQPSLWDSVLPEEVRRMSPLLEQVDRWLDDEAFFAPFRAHFNATVRPAEHPGGGLSPDDVPEVPVPVGV